MPQRRHEDVHPRAVRQDHRGAGAVDEQLLAGAVNLAHRAIQALGERLIVLAELRVAVGLSAGVLGLVFLPQRHQRHTLTPQLLVGTAVVRHYIVRLRPQTKIGHVRAKSLVTMFRNGRSRSSEIIGHVAPKSGHDRPKYPQFEYVDDSEPYRDHAVHA
jgi:hypothetical protein